MEPSRPNIPHTKQERSTDPVELKRAFRDAVDQDFGHLKSHLKVVASKAGTTPRTVEAWTDQRCLPGLEYFLELGKHSPAIQKMTMRLWNLDPDIDPEYQRAFMDLVRAVQSRGRR